MREYVWSKEPKSAEASARQADLYCDVTRINDTIPKYSFWSRDAMKQSNGFSARPDKPPVSSGAWVRIPPLPPCHGVVLGSSLRVVVSVACYKPKYVIIYLFTLLQSTRVLRHPIADKLQTISYITSTTH